MLQKLSQKGLLKYTRYHGVNVTENGIIKAKKLLRNHRILEILFVRCLKYNSLKACEEASELDHYIPERLA